MFVKSKPGLKVRDPQTKGFLPTNGGNVPDTLYWVRRLRDGDVIETTPAAAAAAAAATAVQKPQAAAAAATKEPGK